MEKQAISVELVECLIAEQFPQWSHLVVRRVDHDGWDNTSFRLGDDLVARLPSADGYIPQVDKEQRWLPMLADALPLPVPRPVALGVSSVRFPRPWSVYRWLPGHPAAVAAVDDREQLAFDLAGFLIALRATDAHGGPSAGPHSCWRGGDLLVYDDDTRRAIDDLDGLIDRSGVLSTWERALATTWQQPPVWVHGDVAASNLLLVDGQLSAVIDFGCAAIGDPACDLVIAWTLFDGADRRVFMDRTALDEDTWARARGWALWKALLTYRDAVRVGSRGDAEHRFGWRIDAFGLVAELICSP